MRAMLIRRESDAGTRKTPRFQLARLVVVFALLVVLGGCAVMKRNYEPEERDVCSPETGVVLTACVGDELLVQGTQEYGKTLVVRQTISGEGYHIPKGRYPMVGEDSSRQYFSPLRVQKGFDSDPVEGLFVNKTDYSTVCVVTNYNCYECYAADAQVEMGMVPSDRHIQKSLIFAGRRNGMLDFIYRERRGENILLSYNVSFKETTDRKGREKTLLGYRGAVIRIDSCTGTTITYEVLRSFTRGDFASQ